MCMIQRKRGIIMSKRLLKRSGRDFLILVLILVMVLPLSVMAATVTTQKQTIAASTKQHIMVVGEKLYLSKEYIL